MNQYPIPTVGALIWDTNTNKILLIKTNKWDNQYSIPGGKIEMGESCEAALIREIKEETNLNIFDIQLITIIDSIYSNEFYKKTHMLLINYTCKTNDISNFVLSQKEAQSYIWIDLQASFAYELNQPTRQLLELVSQKINSVVI